MAKFMLIYHQPPAEAGAAEMSPERMQAVMAEWMEWGGRVGEAMLDFGDPLAAGIRVTAEGISESRSQVTGYSLIEAADLDAAKALTDAHPHLAMPGGEIEIYEAQPIPGS